MLKFNEKKSLKKTFLLCIEKQSESIKTLGFTNKGKRNQLLTASVALLFANLAFAFDYNELNATIVSKKSLDFDDNNTKIEQIVISKNDTLHPIFLINDRFVATEIVDIKSKSSLTSKFYESQIYDKFEPILNEIPKEYIINFNNGAKTQYLFLDPMCGYCQDFISKLNKEQLKDKNLNVILTPLFRHGDLAVDKSALIIDEIKNTKDDLAKIKILQKYFTNEPEKVDANLDIIKAIDTYRQKLFNGEIVTQTPSVIVKP